jgi:hypothetical protein
MTAMLFVRAMLRLALVALVAPVACASHAKQFAKAATLGVKTQIAAIDPAVARTVGDQVARGAVSGALAELESAQHREVLGAIVDMTSKAATQGMIVALRPDREQLQELVDHTLANAVGGFSRQLAADRTLRDQLAAISYQASASAVYGARDALVDIFPECTGSPDRRHCVEAEVGVMSRAAARGMMGGFVDIVRWPILVLVFLAGAGLTLLVLGGLRGAARRRAPERHHSPRA